ncbi:Outer envelope membrane protein 7 [Linum grandiflorum]
MGAVTTAIIAIAGVILGWITIEIACKPCLDQGRQAIDRSLNPDYDPDDDINIRAPLNPSNPPILESLSSSSTPAKAI